MVVPWPGWEWTARVPPCAASRSDMPCRPEPWPVAVAGKPAPSSLTENSRTSPEPDRWTVTAALPREEGRGPGRRARAGPRRGAAPDPRLAPAGPGRPAQQRHHPVRGVAQVELARHVGGEVGQDLVRRGPVAVDQAVGQQA